MCRKTVLMCVALVLAGAVARSAIASSIGKPLDLRERIQRAHLVCEARLIAKETPIQVTNAEWFGALLKDEEEAIGKHAGTRQPLILEITCVFFGLAKVGERIDVIASWPVSVSQVEVNQVALFVLEFNPAYRGGCYVIPGVFDALAKVDGSYVDRERRLFSEEYVRSAVEEVSLPSVAEHAELAIIGHVLNTRPERRTVDGRDVRLRVLSIQVDETLIGAAGAVVEVSQPLGRYNPPWRRPMPSQVEAGTRWLLFLVRGEVGWYPYMGHHGMLGITKENQLLMDGMPMGATMEQVRRVVGAPRRGEQR